MRASILIAILLMPAVAAAKRVGAYDVTADGGWLVVAKGGLKTRLVPANGVTKASLAGGSLTVVVEDNSCTMTATHAWTTANLDARLENAPAYRAHQRRDYKTSAAGFARAVAADPTWPIAAYNLASAHQLLGDRDAAIKALAPWLASHPVRTLAQITRDPELAPLLARPEVTALHAKTAGTVKLTWRGVDGEVAYAPERKLYAYARTEGAWGASLFLTELEIRDAAHALVATVPLVEMDDTRPDCYDGSGCELLPAANARVARRVAEAQGLLRALGFSAATVETGVVKHDDAKHKAVFSRHKLGLVALDGTARVLRGNTVLATAGVAFRVQRAVIVDELSAMLVWSVRPGAEGCEATDPTQVDAIPLPP